MGDIAFVRNRGRAIARTAYASRFRYKIPKSMRKACPEIAALIVEMWDGDFRKRPPMSDVVVRLEACATVEGVVASDEHLNSDEPHEHPLKAIDQEPEAIVRALRPAEFEIKAFSARLKESRLEVAKLKAALLAGTSLECDEDDVGILGGMFICTYVQCGASHFLLICFTARNSPNEPRIRCTVDPDKERSVLGKGVFGTVYTMVNPHDSQAYAVKELTNLTLEDGSTDEAAMHELLAEVRKMGGRRVRVHRSILHVRCI